MLVGLITPFTLMAKLPQRSSQIAIVAQLVEHNLAKVRVAGSNPVYRSMKLTEDGLAPLKETLTSWG